MATSPANAPTQQRNFSLKHLLAQFARPKVFSYLLLTATTVSVLSMLCFLTYLLIPSVLHTSSRTHYAFLYVIGVVGLAIAEACQICGIINLIVQWASKQNTEKKPREIVVLALSLIPYMVIAVFLITLSVYLYMRRKAVSTQHLNEARQELREQAVDTVVDYGANRTNTSASSVRVASLPHRAPPPVMKDAVRQIIGPTAEKSVSGLSNGLLVTTVVALIVSTLTLGGVVVPQVAPPNSQIAPLSTASAKPGRVRYFSLGTFQVSAISSGPDGNLWFVGTTSAGIVMAGRLTPTGDRQEHPLQGTLSQLSPINSLFTAGPDGNLWFMSTLTGGISNFIERITPTGSVRQFPLPASELGAITAGSDGNVWFTTIDGTTFTGQIERITPGGTIQSFSVGGVPAGGIISGSDGNVWFGGLGTFTIGRLTPTTGQSKEFTDPATINLGYSIDAIADGPDGNVWLSMHQAGDNIYATESVSPTGAFQNFQSFSSQLPLGFGALGVTVGADGSLSCGEGVIGSITPSGTHLIGASTLDCLGHIAVGTGGRIWFANGNQIGLISS